MRAMSGPGCRCRLIRPGFIGSWLPWGGDLLFQPGQPAVSYVDRGVDVSVVRAAE